MKMLLRCLFVVFAMEPFWIRQNLVGAFLWKQHERAAEQEVGQYRPGNPRTVKKVTFTRVTETTEVECYTEPDPEPHTFQDRNIEEGFSSVAKGESLQLIGASIRDAVNTAARWILVPFSQKKVPDRIYTPPKREPCRVDPLVERPSVQPAWFDLF